MATVIAVANAKGGCGKSNLVVHLSGLYALAGHRVLTIDLDPQGNLVESYGLVGTPVDDGGAALSDALLAGAQIRPCSASRPDVNRGELYTAAGGPALTDVYVRMLRTFATPASVDNALLADTAAYWLRTSLDPVADDFDLVLIDCPPGIAQLQILALTAADFALFPVGADISERKGVRLIADVFARVRELYNPDLQLAGIVPMRVKRSQRRTELATLRSRLAADFGGDTSIVFDAWVAEAAAAALQARSRGLLVHELDDQREAAEATRIADLRAGRRPRLSVAGSAGTLSSDYTATALELIERMNVLNSGGQLSDLERREVSRA